MRKSSTHILRLVLIFIGLIALAICTFLFPYGIITDITGWYRPLLIGMYVPSIPFFIALFHAWKLLNLIDKKTAFSDKFVTALKNIKYCAFTISIIFTIGMPYIFWVGDKDDAPGIVAIGLVFIFTSFVIGTFAGLLQKLIQNAVDLKSENDLTV